MKIAVNKCYGGFDLSLKGKKRLAELLGKEIYFYKQTKSIFIDGYDEFEKIKNFNENLAIIYTFTKDFGDIIDESISFDYDYWFSFEDIKRNNPYLIQVVEELGEDASSKYSQLEIVEIPNGVDWQIEEYDGIEWVAEKHRTWD